MWTSIHIYMPDGSTTEDLHYTVSALFPVLKVGDKDDRHLCYLPGGGTASISINHESDEVRESRSYESQLSRRGRIEPKSAKDRKHA